MESSGGGGRDAGGHPILGSRQERTVGETAGLGLAPVQKDRPCGQWDLKWKHESLFKRVFKGRPLRELLEAGLIKMGRRGRSGEQASLHRGASGVTRWPIHGHCH